MKNEKWLKMIIIIMPQALLLSGKNKITVYKWYYCINISSFFLLSYTSRQVNVTYECIRNHM